MTTSSHVVRAVVGPKPFKIARKVPAHPSSRPTGFWQTWWNRIIPFGYEDETGFHYGVPAQPTAAK